MAQSRLKFSMLRAEVRASALRAMLRASQNVKESWDVGGRAVRLVSGRGVGECEFELELALSR